ncbi:unnamed protein product [Cladocopium goreaui]|uniref:Uncharacterized protein n=1 Tax=Cladocopium goreaui TaxID=2562237 RepID=A0A9P1GE40_9DINO|nr:unnamed protein product [Cladocopium goreaui]
MSLEELRQDLMQPNRLLMSLASKFHPLAVKLAFIRLWGGMRELLEKYLGIDDAPVRSEEVKMIMQQILNKAEADEIKAAWRSGRPADQFHNLCEIFSHQLNSEPTTLQALFAAILVPKVKECLPDVAWEDLKAVLANLSLDDLAIFRKRLSSLEGWKDLSLGDVFQSEELSVALEMVRLRPTLEPMLPEGISWATARLLACDPSSKLTAEGMRHVVAEVVRDPDRFVLQLLGQLPSPQEWLLNHMKPQLECLLPAGACWQEIADCLRMILPDRDQSLVGHLHVVFSASWRLSSHTHYTNLDL